MLKETAIMPNPHTVESGETEQDTQTPKKQQTRRTGRKKRYREKGAGSIVKIGRGFQLQTMFNGKLVRTKLLNLDGTPCRSEKDAEKAAEIFRKYNLAKTRQDYINDVAEAKGLRRKYSLSVLAAWKTYIKQPTRPNSGEKTLSKYETMFRRFTDWITKNHPEIEYISAVDHDVASAFMESIWDEGISAVTFNAYLQALRMIFKHLRGVADLDKNPFDEIPKKPNAAVSRREFSPEQVKAIFDGFDVGFLYWAKTGMKEYTPMFKDEMRVLFLLCCFTGCRGQDGCLMEWKNIDLNSNKIAFIPKKTANRGGRMVVLPIESHLRDALEEAYQWRDENKAGEDYVLPHVAERYKRNPSGVQKDVMKIIRLATGLETKFQIDDRRRRKIAANAYSLHSFRHTFVSFCANAGVPMPVVASIVGHGNPSMTMHYSHASEKSKKEATNAVAEAISFDQDDVIDEPLSLRRATIMKRLKRLNKTDSATLAKIEALEPLSYRIRAIKEALQTADPQILSTIEAILSIPTEDTPRELPPPPDDEIAF